MRRLEKSPPAKRSNSPLPILRTASQSQSTYCREYGIYRLRIDEKTISILVVLSVRRDVRTPFNPADESGHNLSIILFLKAMGRGRLQVLVLRLCWTCMVSTAVTLRSSSAFIHPRACFVAGFSSSSLNLRNRKTANAKCCLPRSRLFSLSSSSSDTMSNNNNNAVNYDNNNDNSDDAYFGRFVIPAASIFYRSPNELSIAFVNLRPIVDGHVLVMSARSVARLEDLTNEEHDDIWRTVRVVQGILKEQYADNATAATTDSDKTTSASSLSFNVAVQDGRAAGQSVPHVHVHILPRSSGDFARNDDVYQELEEWAPRPAAADTIGSSNAIDVPDDDQRRDRTREEMAQEAALYRKIIGTE
jgi:bis(5'-adenosyl)-triphosphatase